MPVTRHPPHKTVRARLRIRLQPWMGGVKTLHWIRVQNTGLGNPPVKEPREPLPWHVATLTAMDQYNPPQSAQAFCEDLEPIQVARNSMVLVIAQSDFVQPFADRCWRRVHPMAQLSLDCL